MQLLYNRTLSQQDTGDLDPSLIHLMTWETLLGSLMVLMMGTTFLSFQTKHTGLHLQYLTDILLFSLVRPFRFFGHPLLSVLVVPIILMPFGLSLLANFTLEKKLSMYTWWLLLYTGSSMRSTTVAPRPSSSRVPLTPWYTSTLYM